MAGQPRTWTSWTYKPGGLRDTQTEHRATGDTKTGYGYPAVNASGTGQPHTLTSVIVNSGTAKTYAYDEHQAVPLRGRSADAEPPADAFGLAGRPHGQDVWLHQPDRVM
ncbi:hypothetical protein OG978_06450 [Streptomyces sp. NBC_01591]|uniref:hypothetical protein n=1 Tax=Streptomyces sp. NBC_01591 TaxID=2975888 RepID=UPI002DDAF541|nr:hypothetical protein [Streptomyces sp. NBC_01591]WSD67049.1 hypothetical protein OG978_06450 [Streptomyces sp. NBC_01591]